MDSVHTEQREPAPGYDRGMSIHDQSASRRALIWILVFGAIVRVGLLFWFHGNPIRIDDEQDYNELATNLAQGGEFAFHPGTPATLRPPLYPVTVAAVYWVFGVESFQAVRCLQSVLSLLNAVLLYRLGLVIFNRGTALCLCGLYCFYPSLLGFNNLILTEVLFTFLLCAFCWALIRALASESIGYVVCAGVLLGLGALTRSVLWLFPPVLSVFLLVAWRGAYSRRLVAVAALLVSFAAPVAPWAIRNTRVEKTFTAVDTMGGRNFMMGNFEHTPLFRSWDAISLRGDKAWFRVLASKYPEFESMTQGQKDKLAMREGVQFVLANPGLTLKRDVVKFFQFWGLERELVAGAGRGYFGTISKTALVVITLAIFGSYATAMISAVFGLVMCRPADARTHWFVLLVIAFICGMHTLVFSHSRYHVPLIPLLLGYSASAFSRLPEIWARRGEKSFMLAIALTCVFVAGWTTEIVYVDLDRYLQMMRSLGA